MRANILALFLVLFTFSIVNAQTDNFWLGRYEYYEDGMNATGSRSYVIFTNLEVTAEEGKITAIYESGENSDVYEKMSLSVEIKGDTAFFYFENCLPKNEWDEEPCEDSEKKGELMFRLVKSVGKNKKKSLLTFGEKNDSLPKGKVFFKKV